MPFHAPMLSIVSRKFSHTEQVQLAAVRPPFRICLKTSMPQYEIISPSKTINASWRFLLVMFFPFLEVDILDDCIVVVLHCFDVTAIDNCTVTQHDEAICGPEGQFQVLLDHQQRYALGLEPIHKNRNLFAELRR